MGRRGFGSPSGVLRGLLADNASQLLDHRTYRLILLLGVMQRCCIGLMLRQFCPSELGTHEAADPSQINGRTTDAAKQIVAAKCDREVKRFQWVVAEMSVEMLRSFFLYPTLAPKRL
jgi:hypothetical protein